MNPFVPSRTLARSAAIRTSISQCEFVKFAKNRQKSSSKAFCPNFCIFFLYGIHKIFKFSSLIGFFAGNAIFRCQLGKYVLPNSKNPNQILLFYIFFLPQTIIFDSFLDFPLYFLYKCKGNHCLSEDVRVCPLT